MRRPATPRTSLQAGRPAAPISGRGQPSPDEEKARQERYGKHRSDVVDQDQRRETDPSGDDAGQRPLTDKAKEAPENEGQNCQGERLGEVSPHVDVDEAIRNVDIGDPDRDPRPTAGDLTAEQIGSQAGSENASDEARLE